MSGDDFYTILGVPPDASLAEIKERFRFLSHAFHPDKFATETQRHAAEQEFKQILAAYEVLSDPERRAHFDAVRSQSSSPGQESTPPPTPPPPEDTAQHQRATGSRIWWSAALVATASLIVWVALRLWPAMPHMEKRASFNPPSGVASSEVRTVVQIRNHLPVTSNLVASTPPRQSDVGVAPATNQTPVVIQVQPTNPNPAKLVWIPPGKFRMGSPLNDIGRSAEEGPQTTVTLTNGFFMSRHHVTQGDYLAVAGHNPSFFQGAREFYGKTVEFGTVLPRPVDTVSWGDATNYCARITQQERAAGRLPLSWAYRLPTEAEWEYACRAGTSTRFSYGDDPGYALLSRYADYSQRVKGTPPPQVRPVGQHIPNPWGLYDMHGNIYQWCLDWFGRYPGGSVTNPVGPVFGATRVVRGGCWQAPDSRCRSASRNGEYGGARYPFDYKTGFRVVLALEPRS
jgi:formylglycine-generating enzyme required for sulfatase activity